jgi:hypothetical protein
MVFWKWYLKYRYKKTLKETERLREVQNERHRATALLNEIMSAQFSLYEVSHGVATTIKVPDGDIDSYIERIKHIQRQLVNNRTLQAEDFSWSLKSTTLDQFFVSTTGFYQDAERAVERLKKAALDLCEAAAKTDQAEFGVEEHNRRLLTKLFINVQTVSKALIEVSLTN